MVDVSALGECRHRVAGFSKGDGRAFVGIVKIGNG